MNEKEMSVTRALVQLKLLDKRIRKGIDGLELVDAIQGEKKTVMSTGKDKSTFNDEEKAKIQSVLDLIEYRKKVKSAIVGSNAVTSVTVADKKYTVAEAIERKNSIEYEKVLLAKYRSQVALHRARVDRGNQNVDKNVQAVLEQGDKGQNAEEANMFAEKYKDLNYLKLYDPLEVCKKTEELEKDIDEFEAEVDLILSESNAITILQIA